MHYGYGNQDYLNQQLNRSPMFGAGGNRERFPRNQMYTGIPNQNGNKS